MSPGERFDRWAMAPRTVTGLVAYRVLLAGWTALYLAPRLPHLQEIYARDTLRWAGGWWVALGDPVPPRGAVVAVVGAVLLALVPFAAGLRPRLAHGVILAGLALLCSWDTLLVRAYGWLALLQWALLWLAPYDALRDAAGRIRRAPRWPTALLMLQFASVYPLSVLAKLAAGPLWLDGRAVSWIASSPDWGLHLLSAGGVGVAAGRWLGWATLALEAFIGFGLWHPRTRPAAMLGVVAFHLALAATLRISVLFGLLMAIHLALFASDATWARWGVADRPIPSES